jgi:polysaccharide chain length determinant protein (PEP-CTERM system associated)
VLPGKQYTPEDFLRIITRRGWLVLITLGLGAVVAVGVSKRLPNRYRSETLIIMVPQGVPDAYVKAAVTDKIEDRLATLQDQILSRSRIERIITDLDLYGSLRRTLPMEDVVQRMRDDITIKVEGKESFRVSYVGLEAKTAQKATERLASLFIEENLRDRENTAENTNQFLDSQLEDAKRRLVEHEKKLEEYRSRYGGELPTQATANLQAIQNAQVQLQTLAEAADRAQERRLVLERQIIDLQSDPMLLATVGPTPGAPQDAAQFASVAQQLEIARGGFQNLLSRGYKPDHPDVRAAERKIRDLEAKLETERQPQASAPTPTPDRPVAPAERLRQQRIRDAKLQIDDVDRQIADKQEQDRRLRSVVAEYQAKLDAMPKRESDLIELTRDYSTLQASYQSLLAKREEAKLAANLERRNIGARFKVLDPARAPERPFSPNRMFIDLGGAAAGLTLGFLVVAFFEYRDSSFKAESDVVRLLDVPVLALVPLMISDADRRSWRLRSLLVGVVAVGLVGSAAALALWRLRF